MTIRYTAIAAALAVTTVLLGACGEDSPAIGNSNANSTATTSGANAAASCATIRRDLDQLLSETGVPNSLDEARRMVNTELGQVRTTLSDIQAAAKNDSRLDPLRDTLQQSVQDAQDALNAVGAANFGTARDKLQAAQDGLGKARDQVNDVCGS